MQSSSTPTTKRPAPAVARKRKPVAGNDFDSESPFRPVRGEKIPRKHLRDSERAAPAGIKYHPQRMPMQAAPDHGDHE